MSVKLLAEHYLEYLRKEAAQALLSLHLSKCHIVGNHMSRLIYIKPLLKRTFTCTQGSHRLEKYLNIQDCLEKSLKINLP